MFKFDLTTLELFVSTIEYRNLAKASRENRIASSAVSKRMSDLEARLGVRLLKRSKFGVAPTSAGLTFYEYARKIVILAQLATASVESRSSAPSGSVRLWSNMSALTRSLPDEIARFSQLFPLVTIELQEKTSEEIVQAIEDGCADVGIISSNVDNSRVHAVYYRPDDLIVIVPPGHPLAAKSSVAPSEISGLDNVGLQFEKGNSEAPRRIRSAIFNFVDKLDNCWLC